MPHHVPYDVALNHSWDRALKAHCWSPDKAIAAVRRIMETDFNYVVVNEFMPLNA